MKKSLFISVIALTMSIAALVLQYLPKVNTLKTEKTTVETVAATKKATGETVADADFAAKVQEALNNNPKMVVNAMQKYQENMHEQAMAESKKMIKDNLEEINNNPTAPFVGPKDAKIVLVEFFDYACGFCHRLAPELNKVIENNKNVKFVFRPLAFLSRGSEIAQKAVLAANLQGKFMDLHNAIFDLNAPLEEENILKAAKEAGLNVEKLKADMDSKEVADAMVAGNDLAQRIQINGVPTLILNGEILQTIDGGVIQSSIDELK